MSTEPTSLSDHRRKRKAGAAPTTPPKSQSAIFRQQVLEAIEAMRRRGIEPQDVMTHQTVVHTVKRGLLRRPAQTEERVLVRIGKGWKLSDEESDFDRVRNMYVLRPGYVLMDDGTVREHYSKPSSKQYMSSCDKDTLKTRLYVRDGQVCYKHFWPEPIRNADLRLLLLASIASGE